MPLPAWREVAIAPTPDRVRFDCGGPALNAYLAHFARQNHALGGAKTFVAVPIARPTRVLGYYAIAPASIAYARVPGTVTGGLARHEVPVFRLARLAVDREAQGLGLGGQLLLAAGARALAVSAEVGGVALTMDAKDEAAAAWYASYGAMPLLDEPHTLVLPLTTIARTLERG